MPAKNSKSRHWSQSLGFKDQDSFHRSLYFFLSGSILTSLVILLVMLCAGDTFAGLLRAIGLYHEEMGLYTDCSRPENANVRFCEPPEEKPDRVWKSVKGGNIPFSLYE